MRVGCALHVCRSDSLTAGIDLHTGNLAFALSVDINSWTVEEVHAALGGEPDTDPFPADRYPSAASVTPGGSSHQPKYLVYPPDVSRLFALCNTSAPSIRVIDFGESFFLPFTGQAVPGTPMHFAAPELLLDLPADVSQSIDIWALGCCTYELLGCNSFFFGSIMHMFPSYIADIVVVLGGEKAIPRRFWDAFRKSGANKHLEKTNRRDFDQRIKSMREKPYAATVPLQSADEEEMREVMRKVLCKALVIEPANRADAAAIVAMMPAAWDTMESGCKDDVYEVSNLPPTTLVLEDLDNREPKEWENQDKEEGDRIYWEESRLA
jgi:serine/threonine protein kinase